VDLTDNDNRNPQQVSESVAALHKTVRHFFPLTTALDSEDQRSTAQRFHQVSPCHHGVVGVVAVSAEA
jgi:hypothetical protein